MNIALWIIAIVLAVAFGAAGFLKTTTPKKKLAENMDWVEDFSERTVKLIGASGLALTMVLAAATHARRREFPMIAVNLVLGGLALFVAIMQFGSQSF